MLCAVISVFVLSALFVSVNVLCLEVERRVIISVSMAFYFSLQWHHIKYKLFMNDMMRNCQQKHNLPPHDAAGKCAVKGTVHSPALFSKEVVKTLNTIDC